MYSRIDLTLANLPVRIRIRVDSFCLLQPLPFLLLHVAVVLVTGVDGLLLISSAGLVFGFDCCNGIRVLIAGVVSVLQVSSGQALVGSLLLDLQANVSGDT